MAEAYVAAGSNVRPRASLRRALAMLGDEFPGLRSSPAYSNQAVGFQGDDFINLVAAFPTDRPLPEVLATLKAVERALGREPGAPKWGPRTLDLDLLLYGDLVGKFDGATLPHRDLATRAWVLGPLAVLDPALRDPVSGATIGELWQRFDRGTHPLVETSLDGPD
ncbi:MAG TPA: 2-amino-4-hydroxy-6-hydroxymethyldihydropteridine diphosphokinase [Steroidobacteraceae bacterium]|nr:2-amino-4-hydroxy-6-hydroxymethyldihydropteridine diphosphokinase [Steroidobacteraceae bacterium]